MASRREDPWLALAAARDASRLEELLGALTDTSLPKLQARFEALALWPVDRRIGEAAAAFFRTCPVRQRHQGGTGSAALGCLWVHRCGPEALERLEPMDDVTEPIEKWREGIVRGARAALGATIALNEGPTLGPLPDGPRAEVQAAWTERIARRCASDLPFLLERLGDPPATDVVERALSLLKYPRTTAIADAAAELVRRPPVKFDSPTPVFALAGLLLAVHGDANHVESARKLEASAGGFGWLELVLAPRTAAPSSSPPPSIRAPDSEQTFHAWIAEAPADLSRRHAFADWLLERGKPLGEFMALQLAGLERPLTPKEAKRVQALQNKHERAWLRRLVPDLVRDSAVFEGGVLAEACVASGAHPLADDPQLATVQRLRLLGMTEGRLRPLLTVARLPSLGELVLNAKQLALVPPDVLRRLSSLGVSAHGESAWAAVCRQVELMGLPELKAFRMLGSVRAESAKLVAETRWVRRLERLIVESITPDAIWNAVAAVQLPVLEVHPEGTDRGAVVWTFARTPDGWSLTLKGALPTTEAAIRTVVLEPLDRLDPQLRSKTRFVPADAVEKRVRGWLEHRGVAMDE